MYGMPRSLIGSYQFCLHASSVPSLPTWTDWAQEGLQSSGATAAGWIPLTAGRYKKYPLVNLN